jgi:hypothetical protein
VLSRAKDLVFAVDSRGVPNQSFFAIACAAKDNVEARFLALWMRIWRVSVNRPARLMGNPIAYRDNGAVAYKEVHDTEKDNEQNSAPQGKLHPFPCG